MVFLRVIVQVQIARNNFLLGAHVFKQTEHGLIISLKRRTIVDFSQFI